jgi:hypothetical protein
VRKRKEKEVEGKSEARQYGAEQGSQKQRNKIYRGDKKEVRGKVTELE